MPMHSVGINKNDLHRAQTAMTYQTLHGFPLPWMAIGMVGVR